MQDFTVKVPGTDFELSSNSVYHIREISDSNAPDGYQKKGISKHPLPGVEEGILVPYHEPTRTWNTGLWEKSQCYTKEGAAGKQTFQKIKNYLIPELENLVDGDLTNGRSSNNEMFDSFVPFNGEGNGEDVSKYKIKGGNVYNTGKPLEFLAVWWALLGKQVVPPGKDGSNEYRGCSYILEDKQKKTTKTQDTEYEKSLATSTVLSVLKDNNKKELSHLQHIFDYVGFHVLVKETDQKPLVALFNAWADKGGHTSENASEFNEVYNKFLKEEDREELVAYCKLVKDIKNSKVVVERRDIYIGGQNLGSNPKVAARKLVNDQNLYKEFLLI